MKLYSKEPPTTDNFSFDRFQTGDSYVDYLLQVHLFMGKDFPPADESGAADPFIIARC